MTTTQHLAVTDLATIAPTTRPGRRPLELAQLALARMAEHRAERRRARQAARLLNPPGVYHGEGNRWRNSWDASYRSF